MAYSVSSASDMNGPTWEQSPNAANAASRGDELTDVRAAVAASDTLDALKQAVTDATSASAEPHIKYRADIDGLRGIAVLAVVGFHAFPASVSGGFVGVDIFFVISGFLISTIIIQQIEERRFTYLNFYVRRIRRIFPALILVLTACLIFGRFTLFTEEYKFLAKHVGGGAGFIANVFLWQEAGYFDRAHEYKPLLHLWSLGVEEQYYLVWPLLLTLLWKKTRNLFPLIASLFVLSLALNVWLVGSTRRYFLYAAHAILGAHARFGAGI